MWRNVLAERSIALAVTDTALDYVLAESYGPVYGARPIRRWLEKKVVTESSKMLVREEIDENSTLYIDYGDSGLYGLAYRVGKNGGMVDLATGKNRTDVLSQVPNELKADGKLKIEEIDVEGDEDMVE